MISSIVLEDFSDEEPDPFKKYRRPQKEVKVLRWHNLKQVTNKATAGGNFSEQSAKAGRKKVHQKTGFPCEQFKQDMKSKRVGWCLCGFPRTMHSNGPVPDSHKPGSLPGQPIAYICEEEKLVHSIPKGDRRFIMIK